MKKALIIEDGVVAQVENESFPIAPPYYWVDCPDDIVAHRFHYRDGIFIPDPEPAPSPPDENMILSRRNELLVASDWTQLPDTPTDKQAWATYRQELRDIPSQPGFPTDVKWPKRPQ